jgi:hypothetical protein
VNRLRFIHPPPPRDRGLYLRLEEFPGLTSNAMALCVGSITEAEAARAREDGVATCGLGYFLFLARADLPSAPIEVLAQFASVEAAEKLELDRSKLTDTLR